MDFFKLCEKRFSYRYPYQDKNIPLDDIKKVVQAGLDAPSGANGQTTRFTIVQDEAVIKKIQSLPGCNKAMASAKAYIVCSIKIEGTDIYHGMSFDVEDCAAAVTAMLLGVTELGLASVWVDGWLRRENRAQTIAQYCQVDSEYIPRIILPLGYPEKVGESPQKMSFEERVTLV